MLIMMNVDDISGEALPHIIEGLMERGANSVHAVQALTKKGRLEYLFWIDAAEELVERLAGYLAAETGTLGVRVFDPHHIRFEYRIQQAQVSADCGGAELRTTIGVKEVLGSSGDVISVKAEWSDLRRTLLQFERAGIAISFATLKGLVEQAALDGRHRTLRGIRVTYPVEPEADHAGRISEQGAE